MPVTISTLPLLLVHLIPLREPRHQTKYVGAHWEETPPVTDPHITEALELLSAMTGDERYALLCHNFRDESSD